jgi:DNA-binding LacI/PurR family transcriptional regulator
MINLPTETDVRVWTVKDVAKLAGVSTATVSRVVNGTCNVSCEARTKVLGAVSRLQYRPNGHAAELGRSNAGIPKKRGIATPVSRGKRAR